MNDSPRNQATTRLLEIIRAGKAKPEGVMPKAVTEVVSPPPKVKIEAPVEKKLQSGTPPEAVASAKPAAPVPAPRKVEDDGASKIKARETPVSEVKAQKPEVPVKLPTKVPAKVAAPQSPAEEPPVPPVAKMRPQPSVTDDYEVPDKLLPVGKRILKSLKIKPATSKAGKKDKETKPSAKVVSAGEKPEAKKTKGKGKRIFVFDLGTANIKLLELVRRGNALQIVSMETQSVPPAVRKNPAGIGIHMSKTIREMLPASRLKNDELRVILPDKSVLARRVNVPGGAIKELTNAIKFQIKKDIPFPLDTCEIQYRGFNRKTSGAQELEILAVDGRVLIERTGWFQEVDLVPAVITSTASSGQFLIKDYAGVQSTTGAVVLVDIGASKTTITIIENDRLILSRTIAVGGDDFTNALAGNPFGPNGEELTDLQAEKFKIDIGLPVDRTTSSLKVMILLRPLIERIVTEINRSLDFYRREKGGGEINNIILFGGGAMMKNLPGFLAENTGIDVTIGNPLSRLQIDSDVADAVMAIANETGPLFLPALAVALADTKELNILPPRLRGELRLRKMRLIIVPAVLTVTGILVLLYGNEIRRSAVAENAIKKIKTEVKDLDQYRNQFLVAQTKLQTLNTVFSEQLQDFESIRGNETNATKYLRVISNIIPENIFLSKLFTDFIPEEETATESRKKPKEDPSAAALKSLNKSLAGMLEKSFDRESSPSVKRNIYGQVLILEGNIYPQGNLTDVQLVDFVFMMENSGHFRDVAIDSISVQRNGRVFFKVICGI